MPFHGESNRVQHDHESHQVVKKAWFNHLTQNISDSFYNILVWIHRPNSVSIQIINNLVRLCLIQLQWNNVLAAPYRPQTLHGRIFLLNFKIVNLQHLHLLWQVQLMSQTVRNLIFLMKFMIMTRILLWVSMMLIVLFPIDFHFVEVCPHLNIFFKAGIAVFFFLLF